MIQSSLWSLIITTYTSPLSINLIKEVLYQFFHMNFSFQILILFFCHFTFFLQYCRNLFSMDPMTNSLQRNLPYHYLSSLEEMEVTGACLCTCQGLIQSDTSICVYREMAYVVSFLCYFEHSILFHLVNTLPCISEDTVSYNKAKNKKLYQVMGHPSQLF